MMMILQFISQNHRPVRGSASSLLLEYIRRYPCKTSITVAGCYLCAAPGSKGTKILVCSYSHSYLPLKIEWLPQNFDKIPRGIQHEIHQILTEQKSLGLLLDALDVCSFNVSSSKSILDEAKKLNVLSESTYSSIIEMQMNETTRFLTRDRPIKDSDKKDGAKWVNASQGGQLRLGQGCYFMNRFFITWHSSEKSIGHANCCMCDNESNMVANIRLMVDDDWLYLAKLVKVEVPSGNQCQQALVAGDLTCGKEDTKLVLDYRFLSAKEALLSLKSIPAAARRGLPVLVNQHQLLSIPSVGFKQCPCLVVSAVFKPRVPLGGGCSSFL